MFKNNTNPFKLIEYIRDGLVEEEHFGFIVGDKFKLGNDNNYPFFLRSCAKPLQASLAVDLGLDLSEDELAISCASHAGEPCHVKVARKFLTRLELNESYLKCGLHKPISTIEKEKLIKSDNKENVFQNNCVGKHILMLAICKKQGWDLKTYDCLEHPLQQLIKEKIYKLCEIEQKYPVTKDGCGVPIHSMPLKNMLKGYLNLFCNPKYETIKRAFLNNPYLIGGENRTDTKIMTEQNNLIAKVGAGGLCIVIKPEEKTGFIVKISDCDMKAREIIVLETLQQLGFADIKTDLSIKTLHNDIVGNIQITFKI